MSALKWNLSVVLVVTSLVTPAAAAVCLGSMTLHCAARGDHSCCDTPRIESCECGAEHGEAPQAVVSARTAERGTPDLVLLSFVRPFALVAPSAGVLNRHATSPPHRDGADPLTLNSILLL